MIILQVLQATLDIPVAVRQELVAGTFERMAVSPFGPVASILSLFLFPIVSAVLTMLVTLALTALVFGVDATWSRVPLAIPVAVVGALALGAIALLFVAMIVRFKQAPGAAYVLAAISLVAGFYFPAELLPWWLNWASEVQPFTPAVDLLRHLLVGQPLRASAWGDVAKLVGFSAVLLPLGVGGADAGHRSQPAAGDADGVLMAEPGGRDDPQRLVVRVPEHVVYRDFAEQTVVLNLRTGRYHGLNETVVADARRAARRADRGGRRAAPGPDLGGRLRRAARRPARPVRRPRAPWPDRDACRRVTRRCASARGSWRRCSSPTGSCAGRCAGATSRPWSPRCAGRVGGAPRAARSTPTSAAWPRAAVRVLERVPGDSRCLTRSLVVLAMLARRGRDVRLVLAARPTPTFAAHAWVERDGRPLLPTRDFDDARLAEL